MDSFTDSALFNWLILPLLIMLARAADVTLATLRNILLSKSVKYLVPFLGFIEALIWLLAISQIMKNLHNPICYFAYASGFALGVFLGIKIEERLALGLQVMRIIVHHDWEVLQSRLAENNFGITVIDARGTKGPVKIILTVVKRREIPLIKSLIERFDPSIFYSIEDIRMVSQGVFRKGSNVRSMDSLRRIFPVSGSN